MNEPFRWLRRSHAGRAHRAQVLLMASAVAAMGVITVTAALPMPARPSRAVTLAVRLKSDAMLPGGGSALGSGRYLAEIRRTQYGIPHILAHDYGGLGYGYGYAFAQDDACFMADRVLTLRG